MARDGGCRPLSAELALDLFVAFFGAWTLLCWGLVVLGGSFDVLTWLAWVPVLVAISLRRRRRPVAAGEPRVVAALSPGLWVLLLAAAGAIVVGYRVTGDYVLFWLLALAFLAVALRSARSATTSVPELPVRRSRALVAALCVVAAAVTAAAHRPDADDAFYLSLAAHSLDHPGDPVQAYDGMFGEPRRPLLNESYRTKSYEQLVAVCSRVCHLEPGVFYWLVFPPLFAMLIVVAHLLALELLGGRHAVIGTAVAVAAFLAWGDEHRVIGNFSFVRLFQGKAVVVAVLVPAIVYYAVRLVRGGGRRDLALLAFAQVAGVGFSSTAALVTPLTAMATMLAAGQKGVPRTAAVRVGLLAQAVALVVVGHYAATHAVNGVPTRVGRETISALEGYVQWGLDTAVGVGWLSAVALFSLLAGPVLCLTSVGRPVAARFAFFSVLLVMNPLTPALAGVPGGRLVWRAFWAIPFPLLIGLVAQRTVTLWPTFGRGPRAVAVTAAFIVAIGLPADRWTLAEANQTEMRFPGFKVDPTYALAEEIARLSSPSDLVLAPYAVSSNLAMLRRHPRLIAVRPEHYYVPVAGLSRDEVAERDLLVAAVSSRSRWPHERIESVVRSIRQRRVSWIVMDVSVTSDEELIAELSRAGCAEVETEWLRSNGGFRLWRCPP